MKTNDLKRQLAAVMAVALTFSSVPAVSVGAVSGLNHDGETVVEGESLTFTYTKDNDGNGVTLSSSNESDRIDGNQVTFNVPGTTTITASEGSTSAPPSQSTDTIEITVLDKIKVRYTDNTSIPALKDHPGEITDAVVKAYIASNLTVENKDLVEGTGYTLTYVSGTGLGEWVYSIAPQTGFELDTEGITTNVSVNVQKTITGTVDGTKVGTVPYGSNDDAKAAKAEELANALTVKSSDGSIVLDSGDYVVSTAYDSGDDYTATFKLSDDGKKKYVMDDFTTTITVTAQQEATSFAFDADEAAIDTEKGTLDLSAKLVVTPENGKLPDLTWVSSDTEVATVDTAGNVTAKKPGTVTITVSGTINAQPVSDTIVVTVKDEIIPTIEIDEGYTTVSVTDIESQSLVSAALRDHIKLSFAATLNTATPVYGEDYVFEYKNTTKDKFTTIWRVGVAFTEAGLKKYAPADIYPVEVTVNLEKTEITPSFALTSGTGINVTVSKGATDEAKKSAAQAAVTAILKDNTKFTVGPEKLVASDYTLAVDTSTSTVDAVKVKFVLDGDGAKKYKLPVDATTKLPATAYYFSIPVTYTVGKTTVNPYVSDGSVTVATFTDDLQTEINDKVKAELDKLTASLKSFITTGTEENPDYQITYTKKSDSLYRVTYTILNTEDYAIKTDYADYTDENSPYTVTESSVAFDVTVKYTTTKRDLKVTTVSQKTENGKTVPVTEVTIPYSAENTKEEMNAAAEAEISKYVSATFKYDAVTDISANKVPKLGTDYNIKLVGGATENESGKGAYKAYTVAIELTDAGKEKYNDPTYASQATVNVTYTSSSIPVSSMVTPVFADVEKVTVNVLQDDNITVKKTLAKAKVQELVTVSGIENLAESDYAITYDLAADEEGNKNDLTKWVVTFTLKNKKYYIDTALAPKTTADANAYEYITKEVTVEYNVLPAEITPKLVLKPGAKDKSENLLKIDAENHVAFDAGFDENTQIDTADTTLKGLIEACVDVEGMDGYNPATYYDVTVTKTGVKKTSGVVTAFVYDVEFAIKDKYASTFNITEDSVTKLTFDVDVTATRNVDLVFPTEMTVKPHVVYTETITGMADYKYKKAVEAEGIAFIKSQLEADLKAAGVKDGDMTVSVELAETSWENTVSGDLVGNNVYHTYLTKAKFKASVKVNNGGKYVVNVNDVDAESEDDDWKLDSKTNAYTKTDYITFNTSVTKITPVVTVNDEDKIIDVDVFQGDGEAVRAKKKQDALAAVSSYVIYGADGKVITDGSIVEGEDYKFYTNETTTIVPQWSSRIELVKFGDIDYVFANIAKDEEHGIPKDIKYVDEVKVQIRENVIKDPVVITPVITFADDQVIVEDLTDTDAVIAAIKAAANVDFGTEVDVAKTSYELVVTAVEGKENTYAVSVKLTEAGEKLYTLAETKPVEITAALKVVKTTITPDITITKVTVANDADEAAKIAAIKAAATVKFGDVEVPETAYELVVTATEGKENTFDVSVKLTAEGEASYILTTTDPQEVVVTVKAATDSWVKDENGFWTWTVGDTSKYLEDGFTSLEIPFTDFTVLEKDKIASLKATFEITGGNAKGAFATFTGTDDATAWTQVEWNNDNLVVTIDLTEKGLISWAKSVMVNVWEDSEVGTVITLKKVEAVEAAAPVKTTITPVITVDDVTVSANATEADKIAAIKAAATVSFGDVKVPETAYELFVVAAENKANVYEVSVKLTEEGEALYTLAETKPVEVIVTVKAAATKPEITKVSAGTERVGLNWTEVEGATGYGVFVKADGKWTRYCMTGKTALYVTGLTAGKTYAFSVKAYVNGKWSDVSNVVSAVPTSAKPIITVAKPGKNSVALNWTPTTNATGYGIFIYKDGKWERVGMRGVTGMKVGGLKAGTTYRFAVKAYVNGKWTTITGNDVVTVTTTK